MSTTTGPKTVLDRADPQTEQSHARLIAFIRIPSDATTPAGTNDCRFDYRKHSPNKTDDLHSFADAIRSAVPVLAALVEVESA